MRFCGTENTNQPTNQQKNKRTCTQTREHANTDTNIHTRTPTQTHAHTYEHIWGTCEHELTWGDKHLNLYAHTTPVVAGIYTTSFAQGGVSACWDCPCQWSYPWGWQRPWSRRFVVDSPFAVWTGSQTCNGDRFAQGGRTHTLPDEIAWRIRLTKM